MKKDDSTSKENLISKDNLISKVDLTFILTILTGLCYLSAYIYYIGKFVFYGIPLDFLEINVKKVILTISIIAIPILPIIWILRTALKNKNSSLNSFLFSIDYFKELKDIKNELIETDESLNRYDVLISDLRKYLSEVKSLSKNIEVTEKMSENDGEDHKDSLNDEIKTLESKIEGLIKDKETLKDVINRAQKRVKDLTLDRIKLIIIIISTVLSIVVFLVNSELILIAALIVLNILIYYGILYLVKYNKFIMLTLFIIFIILSYVFIFSFYIADEKEKYITFEKDEQHYIVLSIYENEFLYVPIDKETNKIEKSFNLIPINQVDNFSKKRIGKINK